MTPHTFFDGTQTDDVEALNIINNDLNQGVKQRPLNTTEQEIYARAVFHASTLAPYLVDALALLRPYCDATAHVLYTDRFSRCGLSHWFFYGNHTDTERAFLLMHECMHILNSHYARGEHIGANDTTTQLCGDLEINTTLQLIFHKADPDSQPLKDAIFPENKPYEFPTRLSFEEYFALLPHEDQKKESTGSQSSNDNGTGGESFGNKHGDFEQSGYVCDTPTPEQEEGADTAGIEKATEAQQASTKDKTLANIADERKKIEGNGSDNTILDAIERHLRPARVSWKKIFARLIKHSSQNITRGRTFVSYRRINKRHEGDIFFPGEVTYSPSILIGVDTSGSMTEKDLSTALNEVEEIVRVNARGSHIRFFSIDSEVKKVEQLRSPKNLRLSGGGGTDMSAAFRYANSLKRSKRPDILIVVTDGYTDWNSIMEEYTHAPYQGIIAVTNKNAYEKASQHPHNRKTLHIVPCFDET
ncbi:MAG: VWA domain-containing protein [Actinomycetaceae bacterium]|nr:VWA domain-containing protein [Actinomycetaceae bacterium]